METSWGHKCVEEADMMSRYLVICIPGVAVSLPVRESAGSTDQVEEPRYPQQIEIPPRQSLLLEVGEGAAQLLPQALPLGLRVRRVAPRLLHGEADSHGEDGGVDGGHVEEGGGHVVQHRGLSEVPCVVPGEVAGTR